MFGLLKEDISPCCVKCVRTYWHKPTTIYMRVFDIKDKTNHVVCVSETTIINSITESK